MTRTFRPTQFQNPGEGTLSMTIGRTEEDNILWGFFLIILENVPTTDLFLQIYKKISDAQKLKIIQSKFSTWASLSWGREVARLRIFFENLRNFFYFWRQNWKNLHFFMILAQFNKILQNYTCFYGILGSFLCAKLSVWNLAAQKNLLLEGLFSTI